MILNMKNSKLNLSEEKGNIWVAVSIIIAGLLVAGAVMFTDDKGSNPTPNVDTSNNPTEQETADASSIKPVSEDDYIKGNINAKIKIVEYSDTECPFCKRLHVTLQQIMEEYPDDVAWVYRHLPIVSSHPKALTEAIATECAAEQGGNDAFWTMLDRIYDETPGNNRLDLALLPQFAADQGLNVDDFNSCLESDRHNEKIAQQVQEGFAAGAQGTPFSVVITPDGNYIPVSGAQPIDVWQQIIEGILETEGADSE